MFMDFMDIAQDLDWAELVNHIIKFIESNYDLIIRYVTKSERIHTFLSPYDIVIFYLI